MSHNMKDESPPRRYRQTARAAAAAETAERVLDAFMARMECCWFDEIRLEDVASDAGVTVQTVIRRFGGKEGLLEAGQKAMEASINTARAVPAGNVARALDAIIIEYETMGKLVIRLLAQEERYAPIKATTDLGRANHRAWVYSVFAPWLEAMLPEQRLRAHDALVIALDIYVWKLLRIDMQRSTADLRDMMLNLCAGALAVAPDMFEPETAVSPEPIHV
ncbi:hypothetical protein A7Q26_23135 [Sphingobium sp. TCM1]|nr:hypothetical protein A7Q26_23135 [Sphingobium sp. TCM1]